MYLYIFEFIDDNDYISIGVANISGQSSLSKPKKRIQFRRLTFLKIEFGKLFRATTEANEFVDTECFLFVTNSF